MLSRRADYDRGENDNANVVFLKDEWMLRGVVKTSREGLVERVRKAQEELADEERPEGLKEQDGLLVKGTRIFVPDTARAEVLKVFLPCAFHTKRKAMRS